LPALTNLSNCVSSVSSKPALLLCLLLAACSARHSENYGTLLLDEDVALSREAALDGAVRTLQASAGTTLVTVVQERGFDVSLRLGELEVENSQKGEGLEIATIEVATDSPISIQVRGPAEFDRPGAVHIRVEMFSTEDLQQRSVAKRVAAYRAWTRATRAMNRDSVPTIGNPEITHAIEILESSDAGDPRLAAHARSVRARMYYEFEVDWRESAREARRAAQAFGSAEVADTLNAARARRLEAAALQEVSVSSKETTAARHEADVEARRIYAELVAEGSALDAVGKGRVFNDLGLMDSSAYALTSAQSNFDTALAYYVKAGFQAGRKQTARNLALRAIYRGDYQAASRAYDIQIADLASLVDADAQATLLINAAVVDINLGATDQAVGRLLRALEIAGAAQRENPLKRALLQMGVAYWARGDIDQATAFFERSLEGDHDSLDAGTRFASLRAYGACMRDSARPDAALRLHKRSLDNATDPVSAIRANTEISRDYAAVGGRRSAINFARRAVGITLEPAAHPAMLDARIALAEALVSGEKQDAHSRDAREIAEGVLRSAATDGNLLAEISARRVLARAAIALGDRAAAAIELERAIQLVFAYSVTSSNPEFQASSRTSQQQLFREYLDLLMSGTAEEALRALQVLENLRKANFAASIGNPGPDGKSALSALLEQLANRHVRLAELGNSIQSTPQDFETLRFEMATLRAQIDRERTAEPQRDADESVLAEEPQWRPLAHGGIQLVYALGQTNAYLWLRSSQQIQVARLPAGAAAIRAAALAIPRIDRQQNPAAYDEALLRISAQILPAGIIGPDATDVEIVADDELAFIPFAALRSPTKPEMRFSQTHAIAMVSSLTGAPPPQSAGDRQWRLVTVQGVSTAGAASRRGSRLFPPLQGAAIEVAAIISRFARTDTGRSDARIRSLRGDLATIDEVRRALRDGADVMHFATHALADPSHPLASLLALPTGFLTAGEIQRWRGDVGLVFLSACETAVGPVRFAESTPGLQRAFLRAGAANVIATLWPIEDQFATEFAQDFYGELAHASTIAEALARTQRRWMSSANTYSPQMMIRRRVAAWAYVLYSR
jgi:CHAT domain-containing protein